jgi:hypothetical protein
VREGATAVLVPASVTRNRCAPAPTVVVTPAPLSTLVARRTPSMYTSIAPAFAP